MAEIIQLHVQQRKLKKWDRKIRNYTWISRSKKWRENSTTHARGENGGKIRNNEPRISTKNKMAGKFNYTCNNGSKRNGRKIRNYMIQLKQKMAGKFYNTCVEGGKWRENPKPPASAEAKKWRKQRMVGYVLPELAASWTRGLKVWTLVQVAVGSTHHLGVLQVPLHIKQAGGIG
jgi:hypothetical protein